MPGPLLVLGPRRVNKAGKIGLHGAEIPVGKSTKVTTIMHTHLNTVNSMKKMGQGKEATGISV